jgi:hypothetical protein
LVVFISFDTIEGVIGNHSFVLGLYLIFKLIVYYCCLMLLPVLLLNLPFQKKKKTTTMIYDKK